MIRLGSLKRDYLLFKELYLLTRVKDRNMADVAAQFTRIATTSKRTPNNFC